MRDRREQILKFICLGLAATLTFQLARFVVRLALKSGESRAFAKLYRA